MRVLGKVVLENFCASHADARGRVVAWLAIAQEATWRNIVDVRRVFPQADYVKPYTIFNIKGNTYRLVTIINYAAHLISIERCLTHAEYDKEHWK